MNTGQDLSTPSSYSAILARVTEKSPFIEHSFGRAQEMNRSFDEECPSSLECDSDVNRAFRV